MLVTVLLIWFQTVLKGEQLHYYFFTLIFFLILTPRLKPGASPSQQSKFWKWWAINHILIFSHKTEMRCWGWKIGSQQHWVMFFVLHDCHYFRSYHGYFEVGDTLSDWLAAMSATYEGKNRETVKLTQSIIATRVVCYVKNLQVKMTIAVIYWVVIANRPSWRFQFAELAKISGWEGQSQNATFNFRQQLLFIVQQRWSWTKRLGKRLSVSQST
jgi:hypothetical protein